jgi:Uma2 family endonuclease
MATGEPLTILDPNDASYPDTSLLITDDGKPVDNLFVEKQYRLLTEPLWTSWTAPEGKPFRVLANVGLFFKYKEPPLVPDVMFALDVESPKEPREKDSRSYFLWIVGKAPDIVIEIVSDKRGHEDSDKLRAYELIPVPYYVIHDPEEWLDGGILRAFAYDRGKYRPTEATLFGNIGLGLTLWEGEYEQSTDTWLRWTDSSGNLIPTGKEKADLERLRAEAAKERAEAGEERAEAEKARAEQQSARAESAEARIRRLEDRMKAAGLSTNGSP